MFFVNPIPCSLAAVSFIFYRWIVLAALNGAIRDLYIKEPSLEDVFLSYSDATA